MTCLSVNHEGHCDGLEYVKIYLVWVSCGSDVSSIDVSFIPECLEGSSHTDIGRLPRSTVREKES